MTVATPRTDHVAAIDWLKGLAMLWVVCIHAKLFETSPFYEYGINRAVPIFLVLFGATSERFWEARPGAKVRTARDWYRSRFARLAPPYFAMTAAFWAFILHYRREIPPLELGPKQMVLSFLGYAPWIGTSWFVTILLELVIVYPVLRRAVLGAGAAVSLTVSAVMTSICVWKIWEIIDVFKAIFGTNVPEPGWYYGWIFAPRVAWAVVAGMFVMRFWRGRPPPRVAAACAVVTVLMAALATHLRANTADFFAPFKQQWLQYLADVPLTIALLGAFVHLPVPRLAGACLAFVGRYSWGIYLGHLLVHEVLFNLGIQPELGPTWVRAIYASFLFFAGTTLAVSLAFARNGVARLRARS